MQRDFLYWNRKQLAPYGQIHRTEYSSLFHFRSIHAKPWPPPSPETFHSPAAYPPTCSTSARHIRHYQSTDQSIHSASYSRDDYPPESWLPLSLKEEVR